MGDDLTPREMIIMLRHLEEEHRALKSLFLTSMPKGSPERHLIEHEIAEQERVERERTRKDRINHVIKALLLAGVILFGQWAVTGGVKALRSALVEDAK